MSFATIMNAISIPRERERMHDNLPNLCQCLLKKTTHPLSGFWVSVSGNPRDIHSYTYCLKLLHVVPCKYVHHVRVCVWCVCVWCVCVCVCACVCVCVRLRHRVAVQQRVYSPFIMNVNDLLLINKATTPNFWQALLEQETRWLVWFQSVEWPRISRRFLHVCETCLMNMYEGRMWQASHICSASVTWLMHT